MKYAASIVTCIFLTLLSVPVRGQEVKLPPAPPAQQGEVDVGAAISPMKKGDKAPFTGLLLSPRATATLMAQMNTAKDQVKIEVDRTLGEATARCDFKLSEQKTASDTDKQILNSQVRSQQRDIQILTERLTIEQNSKSNTWLWTGLGFAGGVVATALTVFVVNSTIK